MTIIEKLEKLKGLADTMYNRMQFLTNDASGVRRAMDEYHQFIIREYYKEDPNPDLEEEIKKIQRKYKTIDEYEGYPATIYSTGIEQIARHFVEWGKNN